MNQFEGNRGDLKNALEVAGLYNQLAWDHGLTQVQIALAFCLQKRQVSSTILGVASVERLIENLATLEVHLAPDVLDKIKALHLLYRDTARWALEPNRMIL
jgi:aryl-alcohol dehydrogenase-like predicted oxidoreductase